MDFWGVPQKGTPFFRLACISLRESIHSRMANRNTPYLFDNRYIRKNSVD